MLLNTFHIKYSGNTHDRKHYESANLHHTLFEEYETVQMNHISYLPHLYSHLARNRSRLARKPSGGMSRACSRDGIDNNGNFVTLLRSTELPEFYRVFLAHRSSAGPGELKHIEAETKWPPFSRRHFKMLFLEWKCMNFHSNFIEFCSQGSN